MADAIPFYLILLLLALMLEPLAERLRIPFAALLVVLGFVASEVFVLLGEDTGLVWSDFHGIIFYVFLPVLIFEAAFNLDVKLLLRNLPLILVLAIPMMLLSAGITAVLLYYGIGHPTGFPWIAALIAGALLTATDPVAVLALFKRVGAPKRLSLLTDGESLFNDATAVVLFTLLIGLAKAGSGTADIDGWAATLEFGRIFFGGALIGVMAGGMGWLLQAWIREAVPRAVLSLLLAYGGFLVAESVHVSGVMTVLLSGLILGHLSREKAAEKERHSLHAIWEYKSWIANSVLFLLSGVSVQLAMFTDQWLAILIGIAAVSIARLIGVLTLVPVMGMLPGVEPVPRSWQLVLYWGGVRGAVTLALALSLPLELAYWWTIQSIAYGVVLFTLFVQTPTMAWLMRRMKVE